MDDVEQGKIIAKNLKRLAYDHKKTQAEIARDLGISKTTLSSWMSGYRVPRVANVDRLAKYFNCLRSDIIEPRELKPIGHVSPFEQNIILAYRAASDDNKRVVKFALGLMEE